MMTPIRYVVGFPLLRDRTGVVLIRKNRPNWQAGKYNGIGGKVQHPETTTAAMKREAVEEAGLPEDLDWYQVGNLRDINRRWTLSFFAVLDDRIHGARTTTDEAVEFHPVTNVWTLPFVSSNVLVMLSLALDTSGIALPVPLLDRTPDVRD